MESPAITRPGISSADSGVNSRASVDAALNWLQNHGDFLLAFTLQRVHDVATAEDLVQETLLAAIESHSSFAGRSAERTWLAGILQHKIIDHHRRKRREKASRSRIENRTADHGIATVFRNGKWVSPPKHWSAMPNSHAEQEELRKALNACLQRLPQRAAQALQLVEQHRSSIEHASKIIGVTATNLSVMLYRARLALRSCLEDRWSPPRD